MKWKSPIFLSLKCFIKCNHASHRLANFNDQPTARKASYFIVANFDQFLERNQQLSPTHPCQHARVEICRLMVGLNLSYYSYSDGCQRKTFRCMNLTWYCLDSIRTHLPKINVFYSMFALFCSFCIVHCLVSVTNYKW